MAGGNAPSFYGMPEAIDGRPKMRMWVEISNQRLMTCFPPYTVKSELGEDCDVDSFISFLGVTSTVDLHFRPLPKCSPISFLYSQKSIVKVS